MIPIAPISSAAQIASAYGNSAAKPAAAPDFGTMVTEAAQSALQTVQNSEQVAAAVLIAAVQAVELRSEGQPLSANLSRTLSQVREHVPFLEADRALEQALRLCLQLIRDQHWSLYGP